MFLHHGSTQKRKSKKQKNAAKDASRQSLNKKPAQLCHGSNLTAGRRRASKFSNNAYRDLVLIFEQVNPIDLLHLLCISKVFRAILRSKASCSIWGNLGFIYSGYTVFDRLNAEDKSNATNYWYLAVHQTWQEEHKKVEDNLKDRAKCADTKIKERKVIEVVIPPFVSFPRQ
ncbi:hypothetical protein CVT25_008995 [Psilocybe cyanescens]|uniref:F-box domain-containing protein n=1 Tax=Psilocybe cyanescens TaxID=93625 RepID=A0A409XNB0_PSICY|nr:hypothetical protein CVT25_008995 [Psilocybe cyanescens]